MPHLYWSCKQERAEVLLRTLKELHGEGELAGGANGLTVLHVQPIDKRLVEATASLIGQQRLQSASLVKDPLPPDRLYVAAEWWGKFVIEKTQLPTVREITDRLQYTGDFEPLNLAIFKVHGDHYPDSLGPLTAKPESAEAVHANPERYYGRYARPECGGAHALFAAGVEAARERGLGSDVVLVGEPEVFGFDVDESAESLLAWRKKGVIKVHACGFSLSQWQEAIQQLKEFPEGTFDRDHVTSQVEEWHASGFSFGIAAVIRGLRDPPVVIPMGSVFQQPTMGSHAQNLAVAQAGNYSVSAGATVPVVLPAWCLNQSFSPPFGPVVPTLLVAKVSGPQSTVWNTIPRRYAGRL